MFTVGEKFTVKTWKEMGGTPNKDEILLPDGSVFTKRMKKFCNSSQVVYATTEDHKKCITVNGGGVHFSEAMVKKVMTKAEN